MIDSRQELENHLRVKKEMIGRVIHAMDEAGELSLGDMTMEERMDLIKEVESRLDNKSLEELQILLSTYQEKKQDEAPTYGGMVK